MAIRCTRINTFTLTREKPRKNNTRMHEGEIKGDASALYTGKLPVDEISANQQQLGIIRGRQLDMDRKQLHDHEVDATAAAEIERLRAAVEADRARAIIDVKRRRDEAEAEVAAVEAKDAASMFTGHQPAEEIAADLEQLAIIEGRVATVQPLSTDDWEHADLVKMSKRVRQHVSDQERLLRHQQAAYKCCVELAERKRQQAAEQASENVRRAAEHARRRKNERPMWRRVRWDHVVWAPVMLAAAIVCVGAAKSMAEFFDTRASGSDLTATICFAMALTCNFVSMAICVLYAMLLIVHAAQTPSPVHRDDVLEISIACGTGWVACVALCVFAAPWCSLCVAVGFGVVWLL